VSRILDQGSSPLMRRPETTWETARLVARPPVLEDAQVLFERYACEPAVAKYMTWRPHRDLEETLEFVRRCERVWGDGSAFPWSLWMKSSGEFVGLLEIRVRGGAVDLGYALSPRWWRQGLMSEALRAVVQWALAQPEIYRVWATCDIANAASARVLERAGMEREGVLRRWLVHPSISEEPRDCLCYSIVKADERQRLPSP
jgi:RimJ/RimL family protein N-acetyltransferase